MNYGSVLGATTTGAALGIGAATVLPEAGASWFSYWATATGVAVLVFVSAILIRKFKPIK